MTVAAGAARATKTAAANAAAVEESAEPADERSVIVAANSASCPATPTAPAAAAHGWRAAPAAVVRRQAAPGGLDRQDGAVRLPLAARAPVPRLLPRRRDRGMVAAGAGGRAARARRRACARCREGGALRRPEVLRLAPEDARHG